MYTLNCIVNPKTLLISENKMKCRFASRARVDGTYMFCRQESVLQAARYLSKVDGLSLQARAHTRGNARVNSGRHSRQQRGLCLAKLECVKGSALADMYVFSVFSRSGCPSGFCQAYNTMVVVKKDSTRFVPQKGPCCAALTWFSSQGCHWGRVMAVA